MLLQHFMLQQTRLSKEGIDELTFEVRRTCQLSCVTSQTVGIFWPTPVELQYSSQIVETDTEFSGKILRFLLHTVFSPEMCLLPPQC